jgi:hypothetical protein
MYQEKRMSIDFWGMVEAVRWDKHHNYEAMRRVLTSTYTLPQVEALQERCKVLVGALREVCFTPYTEYTGYLSDSFDYACTHAVGCGERVYNHVLENPWVLPYLDYEEGFQCGFPTAEDYEEARATG